VLRWTQTIIELANRDRTMGNLIIGSPVAVALAMRGVARLSLGRPGWRDDFDQATELTSPTDALSRALLIAAKYAVVIPHGLIVADDVALDEIDKELMFSERSGDDFALGLVRLSKGLALVQRDSPEREHGLALLAQVHEMAMQGQYSVTEEPLIDVYVAQEQARRGHYDEALRLLFAAERELVNRGEFWWCIPATSVLVETLLERRATGDDKDAEAAIERLATAFADQSLAICDITLLRLRALLARAHGDAEVYNQLRDRYRDMARTLGFEGHIEWAEAMP